MLLDVTLDINIWCKSRPSDKGMAPIIQTLSKGGGPSLSIFFSALWASVWAKNKEGGGRAPWAPPLDPPLTADTQPIEKKI